MITCIGYYSKQILPFHYASGEGVLPYIGYIGMNTLKRYGFLDILVRNTVSILVILGITLERGAAQPRPSFFPGLAPPPLLSPCALGFACCG